MNRKRKIALYIFLTILSIVLFLSVLIFNVDGIIGFIMTLCSFYLFIGSIIKLCKISDKFKNSVFAFLDLLFWLP